MHVADPRPVSAVGLHTDVTYCPALGAVHAVHVLAVLTLDWPALHVPAAQGTHAALAFGRDVPAAQGM